MKNNTHPYCLACSPSLHSAADSGRVGTVCAVWPSQTRHQLDKKRYHDNVTRHVVFPGQVMGQNKGERGLREGGGSKRRREFNGKCSVPRRPVTLGYGS